MNYIKSLHIEGFKKFVSLDVQFNEHMNILVGENEAGKSTILDALKTVLNQQYRNADKSVLRDLFNAQMVAAFKAEPSVKTLPRIYIEVELALNPQQKNASYFYGEVYGQRKQQIEKFGIRFECNKLIHLSGTADSIATTTISLKNFEDPASEMYINRWMDITKSTMLFSRGIILVEGIAEALIIPKIAEVVLKKYNQAMQDAIHLASTLDEMGISVININGIQ